MASTCTGFSRKPGTGRRHEFSGGRSRRGIILYYAMGLLVVLGIFAGMLYMLGVREVDQSIYVYHSEVITHLAEAATEEVFLNIVQQLNIRSPGNRIYDQVRQSAADAIVIDGEYLKKISVNARKTALEDYGIPDEKFVIKGQIGDIQPFDIPGFKNPPDPIEKHGSLKLEISIEFARSDGPTLKKTVAVSRPFKVVRCTIPVLSECTLFVNNLSADYFGSQESVFGYQYKDFPNPQKALVLDNGWAGTGQKTFKKSEFTTFMENEVVRNGKVPPGRIFINKGIVPLSNGDRSSGALQKTFHSGESEFLPQQVQIPLKALKDVLEKKFSEAAVAEAQNQPSEGESVETSGPADSAPATPGVTAGAIPGKGDIIFRYIGHGRELFDDEKTLKDQLGGKSVASYRTYFSALAEKEWKESRTPLPSLSGLALFGNVIEKEKGKAVEGEGFFGKIWAGIKKITSDLLEKLYSNYRIRISPTLVYGDVIQTYFMVRDYLETGWWDKIKNTLSFNPNQFPLPYFPKGFMEGKNPDAALSKADELPPDWTKDVKEKWLKLPEELRKPKFYITLNSTILAQPTYGLGPEFIQQLPAAVMFGPYNLALLEFLIPEKDSAIRAFLDTFSRRGFFFLKNELDKQFAPQSSPFKEYDKPLTDFNPFLFYLKATDYISSLIDPRTPKVNQFYKKYYNQKDRVFDLNGVIYITGTEDLVFANNKYRGKAIIITFGKVVFKGFMVKHEANDKPDSPEKNALLTIVALGGIEVHTSERIDAQLYSYIYPMVVSQGNKLNLFGSLGCNFLDMSKIPEGGRIVFDYSYHIDSKMQQLERDHFYYVSVTNEINRYEYAIRRDYDIVTPTE
ncbi:MAG: hypothetical protein HY816_04290 [Candidatus Wallbacteria bacterium]|nr:hypothetical protein [Candidatus Wallbacteria bacterium]